MGKIGFAFALEAFLTVFGREHVWKGFGLNFSVCESCAQRSVWGRQWGGLLKLLKRYLLWQQVFFLYILLCLEELKVALFLSHLSSQHFFFLLP